MLKDWFGKSKYVTVKKSGEEQQEILDEEKPDKQKKKDKSKSSSRKERNLKEHKAQNRRKISKRELIKLNPQVDGSQIRQLLLTLEDLLSIHTEMEILNLL